MTADAVAGLDALGAQQAGDARGGVVELGVGQLEVVELDRDAVGMSGGAVRQEIGEIGHGRQAMAAPTAASWGRTPESRRLAL